MADDTNDNTKFDIKTHVEWVNHASIRTRTVSVVLVIATVLTAIGFYNSLKWSWARDRIKRVYNTGDRTIFALMDGENHPKFKSDSFFVGNDFTDFKSLAFKIINYDNKVDSFPKYIYERLDKSTKEQLAKYIENPKEFETNQKAFVKLLSLVSIDFNNLLKDKNLYAPERFEKIKLNPETKKFLEYTPGGNHLIRFNRLLIEDYFPYEVVRSRDISPEDEYRKDLQRSVTSEYIENIRFIKIPFFGIAFDVNDLGTIGGLGLLTILLMFRFSLSREIKNLRYAFKKARKNGELDAFYHALAMNQVLTVPEMKNLKRNPRLAISFVLVPLMPALIFSAGVVYDWWGILVQRLYSYNEAYFTMWIEALWLPLIWILAIVCTERIIHIDKVWKVYWRVLVREKSKPWTNPYAKKIRKIKNYVIYLRFLPSSSINGKASKSSNKAVIKEDDDIDKELGGKEIKD